MTITSSFGLLSSTGMQSMQNFQNNARYMNALATVSVKNTATGNKEGFSSSVFSLGSGIGKYENGTIGTYGMTSADFAEGSIYSKGYATGVARVNQNQNLFKSSNVGTSIVGDLYSSISSVALGQGAPTSIFEQRLAYSMGMSELPSGGTMYGDFSNFFNIDSSTISKSSQKNTSGSTSFNFFC